MKGDKQLLFIKPLLTNIIRFSAYYVITAAVITFLYGGNFMELITPRGDIPDIFRTAGVCSVLFVLFSLLTSAIAVTREQSYFKSSLMIRLIVFIMNVIPIALFQHNLFNRFGFRIIYFVLFYLIIQLIVDFFIKPFISKICGGNAFTIFLGKYIPEAVVIIICCLLVNMPWINQSANMKDMNLSNFSDLSAYLLYIVLFNSVTFFTVEYCIGVFRGEYKKNYTKYYFLHNKNMFSRIFYVLRNAMPQVLGKIRKNLSWLVMFILAVDSIFGNNEGLGSNLLKGYISEDAGIISGRVFYLLLVMFSINVIIDIILSIFHAKKELKLGNNETGEEILKTKNIKKTALQAALISAAVLLFVGTAVFNNREYAFAGFYDFTTNQNRTFGDYLKDRAVDSENCPVEIYNAFRDTPLCQKTSGNYFLLFEMQVRDKHGTIFNVFPFYDKDVGMYCYIQKIDGGFRFTSNYIDLQNKLDFNWNFNIIDVKQDLKYKAIAFTQKTIAFQLRKSEITLEKPLYLVMPYYIFYFTMFLAVVIGIVYFVYYVITSSYFTKKNYFTALFAGKLFQELTLFLNSLTIILVFLLINHLFQKSFKSNIENIGFLTTAASYFLLQLVITIMFTDSYFDELTSFTKRIKTANEFRFYNLIGMHPKSQYEIFKKKYGHSFNLKLVFQNILFVLNINWFIVYAFKVWRNFNDSMGITYAISFENIFTKIIHYERSRTDWHNILVLIVLYAVLFSGYYIIQKRIVSEKS
jgi:hypothetical protein